MATITARSSIRTPSRLRPRRGLLAALRHALSWTARPARRLDPGALSDHLSRDLGLDGSRRR